MTSFIPVCLICNKEFYSKIGLTMHLNKFHSKEEMVRVIKRWGNMVN